MKKPLTERMESREGTPKTWIADVHQMQKTIEEQTAKLAEYLETIDALARIVEEYEQ